MKFRFYSRLGAALLFLAGATVCMDTARAELTGFKGRFRKEGLEAGLVDSDGENCGKAVFKFTDFRYSFFVLMGEPCEVFQFNHEFRFLKFQCPMNGHTIYIEPADGTEAVYEPSYATGHHGTLKLPLQDFLRLKVTDFVFTLNFIDAEQPLLITRNFPGYIKAQRKGSFDVPGSPNWDSWGNLPVFLRIPGKEFIEADHARAAFARQVIKHKNSTVVEGTFNWDRSLELKDFEFSYSELVSICAKHGLLDVLYEKDAPEVKFQALIRSFAQGAESPERQLKTYEAVRQVLTAAGAPASTLEMVGQLNREWFNAYISGRAPMSFDGDSYAQPEKMNKLLTMYEDKNEKWLPYSDLSFDFSLQMKASFRMTAYLYYRQGLTLQTSSYSKLPDEEKRRRKEKAAEERRRLKADYPPPEPYISKEYTVTIPYQAMGDKESAVKNDETLNKEIDEIRKRWQQRPKPEGWNWEWIVNVEWMFSE
ncbi:hypothetical protein [Pontiella agarivorans]|uniref:Uncharacterized protein n=1 Tax=Pontiella agarivorans TaxID=3038953 RepID=A0ABU5MWQ8_9BACT|nr:hypothetical protein [Pontiella agarivorans]MDZ8118660.1 hypothetical protein [Pontiella agarivorans]